MSSNRSDSTSSSTVSTSSSHSIDLNTDASPYVCHYQEFKFKGVGSA
jgi:hypothetical protein